MNKNPETIRFWRLWSPLLIYWGLQLLVKFVIEGAIVVPKMMEMGLSGEIKAGATFDEQFANNMDQLLEWSQIILKYQVHIMTIAALVTLVYTVSVFLKDRKAEQLACIPVNKKAGWSKYIWIVVLAVASCLGLNCLVLMVETAFPSPAYEQAATVLYSVPMWLQLLGTAIIIPVSEEMMFRGVLFKRYRESRSFLMAALCSALIFGLIHGNMIQFIYAFVLGMLFAYTYEKYGSIKAPIVFHMIVNFVSIVITETDGFTWLFEEPFRIALTVVICAFIGSVMFVMIQRIDETPDTIRQQESEKNTPDMFR